MGAGEILVIKAPRACSTCAAGVGEPPGAIAGQLPTMEAGISGDTARGTLLSCFVIVVCKREPVKH